MAGSSNFVSILIALSAGLTSNFSAVAPFSTFSEALLPTFTLPFVSTSILSAPLVVPFTGPMSDSSITRREGRFFFVFGFLNQCHRLFEKMTWSAIF